MAVTAHESIRTARIMVMLQLDLVADHGLRYIWPDTCVQVTHTLCKSGYSGPPCPTVVAQ